ncbi:hypothetical protein D6D03_05929 [Aureobasidium pullulans]|nr:hypothetical protein D6D03_05929 [Aureobasidium pullulans]
MGVAVSKYFRPSVELANTIQPPATDQQTQQETPRETLSKLADSKQATVHRESNVSSQHSAPDFAPVDDRSSTPLEQSQQSYLVTAFACAPSRAKISGLVKRLIDQYADAVDVPDLVFKAEERHLRPKAPASNRSTLLLVSPSIESDNSATAPVQSIPTSTGSPVLFKPRTATSTVSTTSIASVIIQEDSPLTPRFKQPILNASLVPFNTSLPVLAEHHDELQAHRESFTPKPAVPLVSPSTLPESLAVPPGLTTHKDRLNTQLTRNLTPISPVPRWIHPCIHASSPPSPDLTALSFVILAKERDNCAAIPSAQEVPYGSLVKIPTPEKLVISPPAKLREDIAARGITTPTTVQLILLHCTMRSMSAVVFAANGIGKSSGAAIAAISVACRSYKEHREDRKENFEKYLTCPTVVIVTSTGELVKKITKTIGTFLNHESDHDHTFKPLKVLSTKGGDGKTLSDLRTQTTNILVCTPGRLADLTGNSNFSARLLHLLVIDQGAALASAENKINMDRIIAWAKCEQSGPIRRAKILPADLCPLTTIVLSHRLDFNLELHCRLRDRYLEFIGSHQPTLIPFARNPRVNFRGQIKVQTCCFNTTARCDYFVKKLVPLHPGERIICIDPSRERVVEESAKCNGLGIRSEAYTTESERRHIIERFRRKECKIMFATPAAVEGIRYTDVKTLVIFASPYESFYTDQDGMDKPGVFKRREDCLRDYVEAIGPAGEEAIVYIFVAVGTNQKIKDAIAQVKMDAGLEVDAVLKPRSVCPNYYL